MAPPRNVPSQQSAAEAGARDEPQRTLEEVLRAHQAQNRAMFAALLDPTIVIDDHGVIQAASDSVERVFQYSPRDLVGRNVNVLMPEPHHSAHDGYLENYRRTGQTNILGRTREFEVVRKDGTHIVVDLSVARADFPGGPRFIGSFRDVTERKRAEAAIHAETSMLRALATIGESAAVLAHEIKNPITAVNLALRAVADKLGEDHKAALEDLVARMQRLEQLMRGTLSFARPLVLKRTEVDVEALFAATLAHMRMQIVRSGSEVRAAVPQGLHIRADAQLMEEVLANLVSNALEAKGRAAHVMLSAAADGGSVTLAVEDDGPGIPEERRAAVFKPFVTTKPSGTGLGLAICRKIVEEHGGSMHIEDGATGGARFVIRLERET